MNGFTYSSLLSNNIDLSHLFQAEEIIRFHHFQSFSQIVTLLQKHEGPLADRTLSCIDCKYCLQVKEEQVITYPNRSASVT